MQLVLQLTHMNTAGLDHSSNQIFRSIGIRIKGIQTDSHGELKKDNNTHRGGRERKIETVLAQTLRKSAIPKHELEVIEKTRIDSTKLNYVFLTN